jgi:hypothetical protein
MTKSTKGAANTRRSAAKKGGTWAGIGAALVGVSQMIPPGAWQMGVGALGVLLSGIVAPVASHVDAKKANAALDH